MLFRRRTELRQLAQAEAAGETFWTRDFDERVRVKLVHAMNDATQQSYNGERVFSTARGLVLKDEGLVTLTGTHEEYRDFTSFLMSCENELVASAVEAFVIAHRLKLTEWFERERRAAFVSTANKIFSEHRVSYEIVDDAMVPLDSQELHQAVVVPALRLLSGRSGWNDVESSYLAALEELSKGEPADAITDASRALQQALERAGAEGNALGPLIASAVKKGILRGHDSNLVDGISKIMHWVSADRSATGEAHGTGTQLDEDAWLAVHVVGALVLRLTGPPRDT